MGGRRHNEALEDPGPTSMPQNEDLKGDPEEQFGKEVIGYACISAVFLLYMPVVLTISTVVSLLIHSMRWRERLTERDREKFMYAGELFRRSLFSHLELTPAPPFC